MTGKQDADEIVRCYHEYMNFSVNKAPSQKEFSRNLDSKMNDPEFLSDMIALLTPGEIYNPADAFEMVKDKLIAKM